MSFLVSDISSVEEISSMPTSPSNVTIDCERAFVPVETHLNLLFHKSLKSLKLRLRSGQTELPWMLGLIRAKNVKKLTSLFLQGVYATPALHTGSSRFGLTHHLTTSLTKIRFESFLITKKAT